MCKRVRLASKEHIIELGQHPVRPRAWYEDCGNYIKDLGPKGRLPWILRENYLGYISSYLWRISLVQRFKYIGPAKDHG